MRRNEMTPEQKEQRANRDRRVARGMPICVALAALLGVGFVAFNMGSSDRKAHIESASASSSTASIPLDLRTAPGGLSSGIPIRFTQAPDGKLIIIHARNGNLLKQVPKANRGFVEPLVRSLERERKRHGGKLEDPYKLARNSRGHLTLVDPSTGTNIYLQAFGRTNIALFDEIVRNTKGAAE